DRSVTVEFKGLHAPDALETWFKFQQHLVDRLHEHDILIHELDLEFTETALLHENAVADALVATYRTGTKEWVPLPFQAGRARLSNGVEGLVGFPVKEGDDALRISRKLSGWGNQLR